MLEGELLINFFLLMVSSFVSFFAVVAIVQAFLFFNGRKNFRLRATLCTLPILKLPFDGLLFLFFGKSYLKNLSPFACEKFLHYHISQYVPTVWLAAIFYAVVALSLWLTLRKVVQVYFSLKELYRLAKNGTPVSRKIKTATRASIIQTAELMVPCAFASRYILIPKWLHDTLGDDEYEAVLAHELEHLRQNDPLIKVSALLISTLFWWVPTKWWLNRLEAEQEQACDMSVRQYGVENLTLVNAIYKVLANAKQYQHEACLHFSTPRQTPLCRVKMLLSQTAPSSENRLFLFLATSGCVASTLFFSIWIC